MALQTSVVLLMCVLFCPIQVLGTDENRVFTEAEKKAFVFIHNRLRETAVPTSASMNFITWSKELEKLAEKAAARCDGDHTYGGEYKGLGENIYTGGRLNPIEITLVWFTEKTWYDHNNRACTGTQCGHYTQVLSHATREIGCARKGGCVHPDGKIRSHTYCEYTAETGGAMYDYGPPCSRCPIDMPFCVNNLCVNKTLTAMPIFKEIVNTASGTTPECKIECLNCGKLDTTGGQCRCDCGTEATEIFCQKKNPDSKAVCSPCTMSPACLNGGEVDKSDSAKCKCICKSGFVGDRCEVAKDVYDNSVKLEISTATNFVSNTLGVMPPVSKSQLHSIIWKHLQTELSKAINSFCQKGANFAMCCPGKSFPGEAGAASKSHVKDEDLKLTESSVSNLLIGSIQFLVHAVVTDSTLCTAGAAGGRRKREATVYVPRSVMASAIAPQEKDISAKLKSCCNDTALSLIASVGSAAGQIKTTPGFVSALLMLLYLSLHLL